MTRIQQIGILASVVLPLFNIPLIVKLIKRKSSKDFSLVWVLGVWGCAVLMLPAALISPDITFKAFGITNVVLFSLVTWLVVRYHR